jgi:glutamate racemase
MEKTILSSLTVHSMSTSSETERITHSFSVKEHGARSIAQLVEQQHDGKSARELVF